MIMCDISEIYPDPWLHITKKCDDMIKITPTVEIYNRSMVQKHPVLHTENDIVYILFSM